MSSRIFLLGNGSSLKKTPLHLLKGQDVMGVNKIGMMDLPFDLKYYVKVDFSAFDPNDWREEIMPHVENGELCLLWDAFRAGAEIGDGNREFIYDGIGDFPNVCFIPRCKHHYLRQAAWHPICTGLNSIMTMVIWATVLDYDEIILVGCDGLYSTPQEDHFTEDYYKAVDPDYANRNNVNIQAVHKLIAENCPIPIYDATVDGYLTQYPKVKLEDVVATRILQS